MLKLSFHPVTARFRPLAPEQTEALRHSLQKHGMMVPIQIWNNMIIDGRARYTLATEMDIALRTVNATLATDATDEDVLDYVMALYDSRRMIPMEEDVGAVLKEETETQLYISTNDIGWTPPRQTFKPNVRSLSYDLIQSDAEFIYGWFGPAAISAINRILKRLPKKWGVDVAQRIAGNVVSGEIRWSSGPTNSKFDLRWVAPYLPPKFARDHSGLRKETITTSFAGYLELNELCQQKTTRYELIQKRKDWPAVFVRPASDEANLERFAYSWWGKQKETDKLEKEAPAPVEPKALPEPKPPEKQKISSLDDLPIIYHGRQLWPRVDDLKEPDSPDYPTRDDVQVAYRLAVDYLRRIRSPRAPDPKLDAMDLRQMFKYLRKVRRPQAVLRVLNEIAHLIHNEIGSDAQNSAPPFEMNFTE